MGGASELIICTKDRPVDLRRCLDSLVGQADLPQRVVVVDASCDDRSALVVAESAPRLGTEIVRIAAAPWLTRQRNIGLEVLLPDTAIVHYVDDDVVLAPGYFTAFAAAFERHPSVVGVTGQITDLPPHRRRWWNRLALLDGPDGAVLRSGVNLHNHGGASAHPSGWLSGCTMAFRRSAMAGLTFDERRLGAAYGEDVEFSLRMATRGELLWIPEARLQHLKSPINRVSEAAMKRRQVHHRWQLARDHLGPVRRWAVVYGAVASTLIEFGAVVARRPGRDAGVALAPVLGLIDIARGRATP